MNFLQKLKPGLPKPWLHLLAGLIWSGVGIYLNFLASGWIKPLSVGQAILFVFGGVLLAAAIAKFGFSKMANKNIHRVESLESEKPCLFAFQKWSSYPLVAFMIGLGIFLRLHSPIPKPYLATLYIGIGGGLFLPSLLYYRHIWREWSK